MDTRGNKLEVIAERLVDSILQDNYLSREKMIQKAIVVIRAWVRENDKPRNYNKVKTEKGILMRSVEQKQLEQRFWRTKCQSFANQDQMNDFYKEIDEILISEGYK